MTVAITIRPLVRRGKKRLEADFTLDYHDGGKKRRVRLFVPEPYATTHKRAKEWASEVYERLFQQGRPKESQLPPALPPAQLTLSAFLGRFREEHIQANQLAATTRRTYELQLGVLVALFGELPLDELGASHYQRLKAARRKHGKGEKRSASTINLFLARLYQILKTAHAWGVLARAPQAPLYLKVPKREVVVYSASEYERLLVAAQAYDPRALLLVLLSGDAGLRASEVVALRWEDIDLVEGRIRVCRAEPLRGKEGLPKSRAVRRVPLTSRLKAALKVSRGLRERVLYRDSGDPFTVPSTSEWLKTLLRKAGLERGRGEGLHKLRHTFASRCLLAGATLKEVQQLLGHATIMTTQIYLHLLPETEGRAIALLEKLGDGWETAR